MNKTLLWLIATLCLLAAPGASAATDWSAQDYDLYPGDFDGDQKTDILYVAKDASKPSGIARSDGAGPNIPFQSWPSNYLGIPWHGRHYAAIVADFNGDGRADIFLQRQTAGDHFLLFADAHGKITGVAQTIAQSAFGLLWSADQHKILAGDFNDDGRSDLFLQAMRDSGTHAAIMADANGQFTAGSAIQSWTDSSWSAFRWSAAESNIFVGDFDGAHGDDLLIQAKPKFALIDFDVTFPVPTYAPHMNGVALSSGGAAPFGQAGVQQWSRNANGVDWSPTGGHIVVGDFDGDGVDDVILQARAPGRPSYLLSGHGAGAVFTSAAQLASNVDWSASSYRLATANFDGAGGAGLYLQAASASGVNHVANVVTGANVSLTAHDPAAATGVAPTSAVGATPGSFAVSDDGAAMYSIPIFTPPGVNGVQPSLALAYSSAQGPGAVGIGWRLAGLSQITRCRKNFAQDGGAGAVLLASTDLFCLDGQKLRLTGAGPYGAAGSTYQTEIDTFARVTAQGVAGQGPAWFKVEAKDGLIYEYGATPDSRIESINPARSDTAHTWALNQVSDRAGNTMTISYHEDGPGAGGFRPNTIAYTYNANASPVAPAAYRIRFHWDARPASDQLLRYVGGGAVRENYRLSRIDAEYNSSKGWGLVRRYQLSYNASGVSARSRLSAVQECDGAARCLAPTTIAWQEGALGWSASPQASATLPASATNGLPIDMNGDGRDDYAYYDSNSNFWRVLLANASGGYDSPINVFAGHDATYEWAMPIDVDGNGRRDLMVANPSDGKWWWVRHVAGTSFTASATTLSYTLESFPADINGDGLDDIVSAQSNVVVAFNLSNGATVGFSPPTLAWTVPNNHQYWSFGGASNFSSSDIYAADFNGDGRNDILVETREDTTGGEPGAPPHYLYVWHVLESQGTSFIETGTLLSSTFAMPRPLFTDINADGLVDLVYKRLNPTTVRSTWRYRLSAGGLGGEVDTGITSHASPGAIADCDGDGFSDLVAGAATIGQFICIRSNGAGLATSEIALGVAGGAKVADVTGDGLLDFIGLDASGVMQIRPHSGVMPDLVAHVTDGFGSTVAFSYAPLTDASVYTKGAGGAYPNIDVQDPLYVVKKYVASDGVGGLYSMSYRYAGARLNVQGRGLLGFASREWTDSRTGIKSRETYRQTYPYLGMLEAAATYQPDAAPSVDGALITRVTHTLAAFSSSMAPNQFRWFPYVSESVQERYEVGGASNTLPIAKTTQNTTVNSYGEPTVITTVSLDQTGSGLSYTSVITNTYAAADAAHWCVAFIERQEIQNTSPAYGSETRTVDYTKDADAAKCRASHEIIEPTDSSGELKVTTQFGYDAFGHVRTQTVTAADIAPRVTTTDFGAQGVFPTTITNAEGEITVNTYNYAMGALETTRDPNHQMLSFEHDGFGRITQVTRPDQTRTTLTLSACTAGNGYCGESRLRYQVEALELDSTQPGAVIRASRSLFDAFGRPLYEQSQTLSGAYATIATNYDNQGRLSQRSQPYFAGQPVHFTTLSYDLIGRRVQAQRRISEADSGLQATLYGYDRLSLTQTDPNGRHTTHKLDPLGQLVEVTDANGGVTTYAYDAFGNLKKTVDPALNEIRNDYNRRGFKLQSRDPDMGVWHYTYFATGELRTQRNEKKQLVTFDYDRVSRLTQREEEEGATHFTYGSSLSAHNIGKLAQVIAPGGHEETFTYDDNGRLENSTTVIDGIAYVMTQGYSPTTGLLETMTYPASTSAVAGSRFKVRYEYANGLLQRTRDFHSPSTIYWEQIASDAAGRPIDEQLGNGLHTYSSFDAITGLLGARTAGAASQIQNLEYQWDKLGNLTQRADRRVAGGALTEDFDYDNLYRMRQSTLNSTINLDVGYNAIGNITSKTGLGTYAYPASGANSVRPHAVSAIGGDAYVYDNDSDDAGNGNMTSRAGDAISWYSFDKPSVIHKGGASSQFYYDANRARYKQVATIAPGGSLPAGVETTLYVAGGLFEKITRAATGVVEYRHYILGGTGAVAIRTLRAGASSVDDTRYLHKDHLGSLDVITDESGGVIARLSYDAFGKRRNAATWSGAPSAAEWSAIAAVTHRGFTFHEHLDHLDAIHMNGRVFDPTMGRFLSADPFIQSPGFSQSFNRYSYTFNNPLSYTDPSGYAGQSASRHPDENPPEVTPSIPIFPPLFPDWNRGTQRTYYGAGANHGLMRSLCNRNPDLCGRMVRPHQRMQSDSHSTVDGTVSPYTPLFRDNFAGRALQSIDYSLGWLTQAAWDGPVRGLFSNQVPSGRELMEAKMGVVLAAMPLSRLAHGAASTRAALTFAGDVDTLAIYGRSVPSQSGGFFNVVTHADENAAYALSQGEWVALSHRSLAGYIQSSAQYAGQPVRLIACKAGACPAGLAKNLSNKLGVQVLAPTDLAYVSSEGAFWTSGTWRLFSPGAP